MPCSKSRKTGTPIIAETIIVPKIIIITITRFTVNGEFLLTSPPSAPIPTWLEYIEWIQGEIEEGRKSDQDLFKQIEKCCKTLEKEEHYRNDKSYLRLWITYADMTNQETKVRINMTTKNEIKIRIRYK